MGFTPRRWEFVALSGIGGPYAIRMSFDGERTFYGVSGIHYKDDARLIAAAPEMYHILDLIISRAHDVNLAPHQRLKDIVGMAMEMMAEVDGL